MSCLKRVDLRNKGMSKVITAIAELPTEALKEWREWVEANGGKVLTPRYLTEGERNECRSISKKGCKDD